MVIEWTSTKERLPSKDGLYLIILDADWYNFFGKTKLVVVAEFMNEPVKTVSDFRLDGDRNNYHFNGDNVPCFVDTMLYHDEDDWYGYEPLDSDMVLYWSPLPEIPADI